MKKIAPILSALCIIASIAMYAIGSNSNHLSELKDFFWLPIPLAVICLAITFIGKDKEQSKS